MKLTCDACGMSFDAGDNTSHYCGPRDWATYRGRLLVEIAKQLTQLNLALTGKGKK